MSFTKIQVFAAEGKARKRPGQAKTVTMEQEATVFVA